MRPQSQRRRRNNRLIAWALVLTVVPVAAATVALHTAYRRASTALVVEREWQSAYLAAARLADELISYAGPLTAIARTHEIYGGNVADQQAALEQAGPQLAAFDGGVVVLDSVGTVRASVPERPEILLQDWSGRRFFQELLTSSDVGFSDATNDGPGGAPVAVVGVQISNEAGESVGALAGMFELGRSSVSSFYASIVRLRMGENGSTYVVDGNDKILYDSSYSQVGAIYDSRSLPPDALQGGGRAVRTRNSQGQEIVVALAPVPRTGWTLIIAEEWASVTRGAQRYSSILLALVAIGVALPAGGAALFVRQRHAETHQEEQEEQARRMASLVHKSLLPRHVPMLPGWELAVQTLPTGTECGDYYDYLLLPDGRMMLTVWSIAACSVQAALVTAATRTALRGAAHHSLEPSAALDHGNRLLCPEVGANSSVTGLYSILDPATGRLLLAGAGGALSYHGGNGEIRQLDTSSRPLGLALSTRYEQSEVTILPGQWMLFVTEGAVLARNAVGEAFGPARLKEVLEKETGSGQALIGAVLAALEGFVGAGAGLEHDITLILLERSTGGAAADG